MVTPVARREAVAHLKVTFEVSERRACCVLGADRSSVRYRASDLTMPPCGLGCASWRPCAGASAIGACTSCSTREGIRMNHKKLRRLYREERLQVRRRGGRKRALGTRAPLAMPQGANQRWSLDFLSDALADGRRFRILAIVDDFTRECLALVADTSLSGLRVARELDTLIAARGKPATVVSDNGTELTSMAILRWSQESRRRMALHRCRQAPAERLRRELQRQAPRRAAERDAVHLARPCPRGARRLAARLQSRITTPICLCR